MSEHKIKLRPFQVPNFALAEQSPGERQDGFKQAPSFALKDLESHTLAQLCRDFRAAVFAKAGKVDPDADE